MGLSGRNLRFFLVWFSGFSGLAVSLQIAAALCNLNGFLDTFSQPCCKYLCEAFLRLLFARSRALQAAFFAALGRLWAALEKCSRASPEKVFVILFVDFMDSGYFSDPGGETAIENLRS